MRLRVQLLVSIPTMSSAACAAALPAACPAPPVPSHALSDTAPLFGTR